VESDSDENFAVMLLSSPLPATMETPANISADTFNQHNSQSADKAHNKPQSLRQAMKEGAAQPSSSSSKRKKPRQIGRVKAQRGHRLPKERQSECHKVTATCYCLLLLCITTTATTAPLPPGPTSTILPANDYYYYQYFIQQ